MARRLLRWPESKSGETSISEHKVFMRGAAAMALGEMGWDKNTGAPTREAYQRLGLGDVAHGLSKLGVLP